MARKSHPSIVKRRRSSKLSKRQASIAKQAACDVYISPTAGQVVDAYTDVDVSWNTTCVSAAGVTLVDLYLYAGSTPVATWQNISAALGGIQTQFLPVEWYNATVGTPGNESASLQLTAHASSLENTTFSLGPTFSIAYNGSDPTAAPSASAASSSSSSSDSSHLTGARLGAAIGAAVLFPILAVILLVIYSRSKNQRRTEKWSNYLDRRMSQFAGGPPVWQPAPVPLPPTPPKRQQDFFEADADAQAFRPKHGPALSVSSELLSPEVMAEPAMAILTGRRTLEPTSPLPTIPEREVLRPERPAPSPMPFLRVPPASAGGFLSPDAALQYYASQRSRASLRDDVSVYSVASADGDRWMAR